MKIVIAIPNYDFEPSEVAVTWKILKAAGHDVRFATPDGNRGYADDLMLTGEGLDPWGFIPFLRGIRVIGGVLRADRAARKAYAELQRDPDFLAPIRYDKLSAGAFDAVVLPGGHRSEGMRPYLESQQLAAFVGDFFDADKPVAAICHGVVVAARAPSKRTGRSALYGRKTTSLTWKQERLGWTIGRVVRFWDPNYYRTYMERPGEAPGYRGVQAEVTRALEKPEDYRDVAPGTADYKRKTDGRHRDTPTNSRPAFVVRDGNYVSARWPGDVHTFAKTFLEVLAERPPVSAAVAVSQPPT